MEDKLFGMLGLARRAGKLSFGTDAVIRDIGSGKAALVILAGDASQRTAQKVREVCEQTGTETIVVPLGKAELGQAMGRGDTAVAAVTDKSFAAGIKEKCRTITGGI